MNSFIKWTDVLQIISTEISFTNQKTLIHIDSSSFCYVLKQWRNACIKSRKWLYHLLLSFIIHWILGNFWHSSFKYTSSKKFSLPPFPSVCFLPHGSAFSIKHPSPTSPFFTPIFLKIIISSYISKTSQQPNKVTQWFAQIFERVKIKISPR